jgi:hypothetical protein
MIGRDAALASMFFCTSETGSTTTSIKTSKCIIPLGGRNSMLTLENIKMHDKHINDTNTQFYPRINKLQELANKRFNGAMRTSTNFTGTFSIFDALYEMESFN